MKINWPRYIGIWEVIGGAWGLVVFGQAEARTENAASALIVFALGIGAATSLVAGIALLRGRAVGRTLSLVVQATQLVGASFGVVSYQLILGPYVRLWWDFSDRVGVAVGATAAGAISLFGNTPPSLAVNLLSVVLFLTLVGSPPAPITSQDGVVAPAA